MAVIDVLLLAIAVAHQEPNLQYKWCAVTSCTSNHSPNHCIQVMLCMSLLQVHLNPQAFGFTAIWMAVHGICCALHVRKMTMR